MYKHHILIHEGETQSRSKNIYFFHKHLEIEV